MSENFQTPDHSERVADAQENNWVDRFAPIATRPYLRLSRADRISPVWLLLIPCLWSLSLAILYDGIFTNNDLWYAFAMAVGAVLMRGAGCTWNDITDRHLDAQVSRTKSRPLPSGQVTTRGAAIWLVLQVAISACILFLFNTTAIILGICALIPVAIYPFAKRFTWWPQVFLGLAFNWGALFGWVAHTGTLGWPPIFLYLAGICWTLFYDTIYAHQDREDDALIGIKSTARLFNTNTKKWLLGFLVAMVLLMGVALVTALNSSMHILAIVTAIMGIWAFGMHLTWQLGRLDIDDAENCLRIFRSNRHAGLLPIAGFILASALQIMVGFA